MTESTAALQGEIRMNAADTTGGRRGRSVVRQVARIVVMAGPFFAILSSIALLSGSIAQNFGGGTVMVSLAFCLPPCGALLFSVFRAREGAYGQATIISVLGGVLALMDLIVAALSAGYANPCFEKAGCTAGTTFGYAALSVASFGFLAAAAVGIVLGPIALAALARSRR
jgi:hypothetical protein